MEKAQSIAELKQVISNLEFQVSRLKLNQTSETIVFFLEPATDKEFRGEGSINEFGGHDVQPETTDKQLPAPHTRVYAHRGV